MCVVGFGFFEDFLACFVEDLTKVSMPFWSRLRWEHDRKLFSDLLLSHENVVEAETR